MYDQFALLLVASFIVGVSKGGLTSAAGIAVPMLAFFMNPVQAAALILPIYLLTDLAALWLYRRDFSGRSAIYLIGGITIGIVIATLIVPYTSDEFLLALTGFIGIWTVARRWLSGDGQAREATLGAGLFWGTVTGITTFIAHAGGPPAQAYLLPQKLNRLAFAGTMAICFAFANYAKIPSYYALGLFDDVDFQLLAYLGVVGLIGTFVGRKIVMRLSDASFVRVIEVLLLILSVMLIVKAGLALV